MKRRNFLKNMLGTGLAAGSGLAFGPLLNPLAHADHAGDGTRRPTLVVIFQRGGCDGLNTVVPFADTEYYNLRPTIGIAEPNPNDPSSALLLDDPLGNHVDFFGLHPSLSALNSIYAAGDMAVMPAVHYPNNSHSHFASQDFIETGAQDRTLDGWLNRHLATVQANAQLQAVHFGSSLSKALRGDVPVQSFSFINNFNLGLGSQDETMLTNTVLPVYNATPQNPSEYQQLVHQYGQVLFNNLSVANSIDTGSYVPENGAVYPGSSYGRRLRETAQLIKSDVGLELVTVDIGGWDTHSGQGGAETGGRQSRRFREFAGGINALYTDLGERMDDVIILTMTEFGRTAKENGSAGTDHGNASAWFMVGRNINNGIHGAWPGLGSTELARGRFLDFSINYRDVMGDILIGHMGHTPAEVASLLPNHTYQPVGLFG